MSEQPYPYQIEQNLIDVYLKLPADERPPFEEWVAIYIDEQMTAFNQAFRPLWEGVQQWAEEVEKSVTKFAQNHQLLQTMRSNNLAAARRRRWRKRASSVR